MNTDDNSYAPYAAPSNLHDVLARLREHGMPDVITPADLSRLVGIHPNVASRVLSGLRFLGLVDDSGRQMEAMKKLKTASANEYPEMLGELVKAAYKPVFARCDPANATLEQLEDAFRFYTPTAQRSRMIALFLGLCKAAALIEARPATRLGARTGGRADAKAQQSKQKTPTETSAHDPTAASIISEREQLPPDVDRNVIDYSLIKILVAELPKNGIWSQQKKTKWLTAVTATLDLLVEVEEPQADAAER